MTWVSGSLTCHVTLDKSFNLNFTYFWVPSLGNEGVVRVRAARRVWSLGHITSFQGSNATIKMHSSPVPWHCPCFPALEPFLEVRPFNLLIIGQPSYARPWAKCRQYRQEQDITSALKMLREKTVKSSIMGVMSIVHQKYRGTWEGSGNYTGVNRSELWVSLTEWVGICQVEWFGKVKQQKQTKA